jgi:hypothetical protein
MSSVPEGRAANQAFCVTTFRPPMGASFPGARVRSFSIFSPASSVRFTCCGGELGEHRFLLGGCPRLDPIGGGLAEIAGKLRYSAPGSRPVRAVISADKSAAAMPSLSVVHTLASVRKNVAPALSSATEPEAAVEESGDEPFEADRHFVEPASEPRRHAVDHRAADESLAHRTRRLPAGRWRKR